VKTNVTEIVELYLHDDEVSVSLFTRMLEDAIARDELERDRRRLRDRLTAERERLTAERDGAYEDGYSAGKAAAAAALRQERIDALEPAAAPAWSMRATPPPNTWLVR
jgi:hypothetical protein